MEKRLAILFGLIYYIFGTWYFIHRLSNLRLAVNLRNNIFCVLYANILYDSSQRPWLGNSHRGPRPDH